MIQYYGIFLDENSKKKLEALLPTEYFKVFCDHMTVIHSSQFEGHEDLVAFCESNVGEKFPLTAITIGSTSKVMAVGIETGVPCANIHKHITLCTLNKKGSPIQSNFIKEWTPIEKVVLYGTLLPLTSNE